MNSVGLVLLNYSWGDCDIKALLKIYQEKKKYIYIYIYIYTRKLSLFNENFGIIASDHTPFLPLLLHCWLFADLSFLLLCHFCYDFQHRDHLHLSGLNILPISLTSLSLLLSELCPSCIMLWGMNICLNWPWKANKLWLCFRGCDHTLLLSFTSVVEKVLQEAVDREISTRPCFSSLFQWQLYFCILFLLRSPPLSDPIMHSSCCLNWFPTP